MERKESLCRTPEYTMDMIKDMYKEEVARALRLSTIMDILGGDCDMCVAFGQLDRCQMCTRYYEPGSLAD